MKEEKTPTKVLTFPFKFEEMKKYTSFAKFLSDEIPLYETVSDILDGGRPEAGGFIAANNVMVSSDVLTEFTANACFKLTHKICKMNAEVVFNSASSIIDLADDYKKGDVEAVRKTAKIMAKLADKLIDEGFVTGSEVEAEIASLVTPISQKELEGILSRDEEFMKDYDSAIIVIQSGPDHVEVSRKRSEHYAETIRGMATTQDEFFGELAKCKLKDTLKEE